MGWDVIALKLTTDTGIEGYRHLYGGAKRWCQ